MRKSASGAVVVALLVAGALALYVVRPPDPGRVYRTRSHQVGMSENTALLLKSGDCLVLSQSEADIGRSEAAGGSESRLFVIAGSKFVRSGRDERGFHLIDEQSGLTARPGDAIDAGIIFGRRPITTKDSLALGWPVTSSCGRRIATVFSISRVHVEPAKEARHLVR